MTSPPVEAEKTPLEERLIALIKANGPMTVADYMADALGHAQEGYYATRLSIGAEGDFTTAPEISQIFGELIGLWLVQSWKDMGAPTAFNLIELGPGRGVMMADILRAAAVDPAFSAAASVVLVETSGRLRHEQQRRLRSVAPPVDWADDLGAVPEGPALIVANEFFDCLPVRQFERTASGWRERLVDVAPDGGALRFAHAPAPPRPDIDLPPKEETEEGAIIEFCPDAALAATDIAIRLNAHPGRALIIDYGKVATAPGDTLQAVRGHRYWPVLASPGRADLTAHVDFEQLATAAIRAEAGVYGPVSQGAFLERLGLALRVQALSAGKSPQEQADIHAGAHRIAAPGQMGELFKVMCLSSSHLPAPAGFDASVPR
ncbi:MAG: SAM-dependent methyltransferase [Pseudomonadota bacterium]